MASFKSNPIFCSLIALCGLAAAGETYLLLPFNLPGSLNRKGQATIAKLTKMKKDYEGYQGANPTPNEENQKLLAGDLAVALKNLADLRDSLTGKGGLPEKLRAEAPPTDTRDAYFKLLTLRDDWMKKFEEASFPVPGRPDQPPRKIALAASKGEWFGFASHKQTGPSGTEQIAKIFRQAQVADYLLNALVAAEPFEFISLHREVPLTKSERDERDKAIREAKERKQALPEFASSIVAGSGTDPADFFDIDPLITARVPGSVETMPFRLTFIGKTESLRSLLNKLAAFELPLVVRRVDTEVAEMEAPPPPPPETVFDEDDNPIEQKPLDVRIKTLLSKFTVTIEYIDLVAPAASSSSAATLPATP
jgi:hypothetical protein